MKIYNKKVFASGVFMVVLGVLNLMADGINHTVDANGLVLAAALFLFGFGAIMRSLIQTNGQGGQAGATG